MAVYAMSDIHGKYDLFMELLEQIQLKDSDTLYVLGDILDRGPHPIKTLLKLMEMPNAVCIVGNHELMALECLEFLSKEITEDSINELDDEVFQGVMSWVYNGGKTTIKEFHELDKEMQKEVIEFIKDFEVYVRLSAGGREHLLVHAGLGNFRPDKPMEEYSLHELVWTRPDYNVRYFDDVYVVSGHTPTFSIKGDQLPGRIIKKNNHIAIDCGCFVPGGRLAAICLDTGEEFYSSVCENEDNES